MSSPDSNKIEYSERELEQYLTVVNSWQLGAWSELVNIDPQTLKNHPGSEELHAMRASAYAQIGDLNKAQQAFEELEHSPVAIRILLAGVHNTLGRARAVRGEREKAYQHFNDALVANTFATNAMKQARIAEQYAQLGLFQYWKGSGAVNAQGKHRKLFIDCGGYDGCSVIKFLLNQPDYDVITFEANPELWPYYDKLPNTLIKKAVYDHDGIIEFTLDPIDADGSSLIKEKKIDFNQKIKNDDCPKLQVECVNLSKFVAEKIEEYDHIELKLDVEGAEYAILETMLKEDTLKYINKLYAEFHWNKIGLTKEYHNQVIAKVMDVVSLEEWDAQEFGVHKRDNSAKRRRMQLENHFQTHI